MQHIYLDHSATTPIRREVREAMLPYQEEFFGNPSSIHSFGQKARKAVEDAREKVATLINARLQEIIFTSGGTEADNLAIKGVVYTSAGTRKHVITSAIEHPAVLNSCKFLRDVGYKAAFLPVDQYGLVNPDQVREAITDETILITIMHANNEIGTIQPIKEIGEIAKERGVYFHTDAVQSVGKTPVDVQDLKVDLLSLSAHKIGGPKGIGALYVRQGTQIVPLLHGGHHELNLRAGTENVAGIVGLGKAAELAYQELDYSYLCLEELRDVFEGKVLGKLDHVWVNGHPDQRLPHTSHLSFESVEGESLAIALNVKGIAVSTGSACSSSSGDPSHVLRAIGLPSALAQGSLRVSLGIENTREEVDQTVEALEEIVTWLRAMSPLHADKREGNRGKRIVALSPNFGERYLSPAVFSGDNVL